MGDMAEANNPKWGDEVEGRKDFLDVLLANYSLLVVRELPDVCDDPRSVAADEGDDDAEENQKQVQLSTPAPLRTKSLDLGSANVVEDSEVEQDDQQEGDDGDEKDTKIHDVALYISLVHSKLCWSVIWNVLWDVDNCDILVPQDFNGIDVVFPVDFCFEKLWYIDKD